MEVRPKFRQVQLFVDVLKYEYVILHFIFLIEIVCQIRWHSLSIFSP